MKNIFCYIWDPHYSEGLNPDYPPTEDGMSVGNPEAKISQTPTQEEEPQFTASSATDTESSSEDESEMETLNRSQQLLLAEQENIRRHRAGTVKKTTQDRDVIISPFAVCGGHRVKSLRQLFNTAKEKIKKKSIKFSAASLGALDSRPGSTQKADPALKVR